MQLFELVHDTPPRVAMPVSILALGSMDQLVPFQVSAKAAIVGDAELTSTVLPTATQSVESAHEAPLSPLETPATFGLGRTDQVDPFQVSTKVWSRFDPELREDPTATQSLAAGQVTSWSRLACVPGPGLGTTDQVDPFHSSLSAESTKGTTAKFSEYPTATQSMALVHDTPLRTLATSTLGLGVTDQPLPSQLSIKVEEDVAVGS
jgi:hypothetical protein